MTQFLRKQVTRYNTYVRLLNQAHELEVSKMHLWLEKLRTLTETVEDYSVSEPDARVVATKMRDGITGFYAGKIKPLNEIIETP
jgi:hypothetical protein